MVGWARGARIPLEGMTFGLLTVLRHVGSDYNGSAYLCRCKCGGEKVCSGRTLRRGKIRSCGCLKPGPKPKPHRPMVVRI